MTSTMRWVGLLMAALTGMACNGAPLPTPDSPATPLASAGSGSADAAAPGSAAGADHDGLGLKVIDPVNTGMTVEGVTRLCDDNIAAAKKLLASIAAVDTSDAAQLSWGRTLGRLDDVFLSINNASEFPYLLGVTHPQQAVRKAARACETKTDALTTSIWLDAKLHVVVKAYSKTPAAKALKGEQKRYLEYILRDFRRNGIELSEAQQKRLPVINHELTQLGQKFIAEIGGTRGKIRVRADSLAGLPDAYKKKHPPNAKGWIEITTDYTDYYPFVKHALDRKSAGKLYVQFVNRGGDVNVGRLDRLLALRHEKAQLLGYKSWAHYAIEPRMAKTPAEVRAYLERVADAIKPAVTAELQAFHAEFQRHVKKPHQRMLPSDRYFVTERLKYRRHKLKSKKLNQYFEIKRVTEGLLAITSQMYGLEFKRSSGPTWHPDVDVFEVWSEGKQIGKFYLDLHPREHKYKHDAMFGIRTGKTLRAGERQTPWAALVCNFPRPGEPMPHDQVVTYFHEFGHVLHHLLTEAQLSRFAGTNTVRDFVEAPSQMFEEWAWSREVVDKFARHITTGEKIPDKMFKAMSNARKVGLALATERQLFLARLDLEFHSQKPGFDSTKLLKKLHEAHFSFKYVKDTHFQSSFGHLIGYDAGYYGYQWALTLAHDVLSRFKKRGLLDKRTAASWRKQVLAPGGGRNERAMIRAFLGREPSEQAYADFLISND